MDAIKHDAGKPAYDLLDPWVTETLTGEPQSMRLLFAAIRHRRWVDALCEAAVLIGNGNAMRHEIAAVLAFGAQRYGRHNWRQGMRWSRVVAAALRHLAAFERGELRDQESGLHHLGHFGCCLMFLAVYERDQLGEDDLDTP